MKKKALDAMIDQVAELRKAARKAEKTYAKHLEEVVPPFRKSATNLVHYMALRRAELSDLQDGLERMGLTRLANAEGHVVASLVAVETALRRLRGVKRGVSEEPALSIKKAPKLIRANTAALLGKKLKGSKVRIMVTLASEAADDRRMVRDLLAGGMNSARINCAHDGPDVWARMVENIVWARKKTGRNCRICMDLGGPKLRTGPLAPGPQVLHIHPERDAFGRVVAPAKLWLGPAARTPSMDGVLRVPLSGEFPSSVLEGETLRFTDARGKQRHLLVEAEGDGGRLASSVESAYLTPGTELSVDRARGGVSVTVGELPTLENAIPLRVGETLLLHRDARAGEPARLDETGEILEPAHVACTLPDVFEDVQVGEPILFDDGKIEGVVRDVTPSELTVEVTYTKGPVARLRADKGINLPESDLRTRALTEKDREDLKFVVRHADVVDYSFVNSAEDVLELYAELDTLGRTDIGVILKIETRRAFRNLPTILLAAMRRHPVGVMLARGDLAIEGGWRHLARLQEEILWTCEAAHVPIVWATQVLETLAKKGRPSRAEITDAAMAQRAECVMLNKGPHILETIRMLDEIMRSMESYHRKQAGMLPPLKPEAPLNITLADPPPK